MKKQTNKTPVQMKTLTLAYCSPAKPIAPDCLLKNRYFNFFELVVPCDQPLDESNINSLIAGVEGKFQLPEWIFVVIPERYRHLDAAVIMEYLSDQEHELPPAEWNITSQ